ncbi:MAG: DNA double-strand break repair nuclease NurA [Nitrososphaerota archaeon]
MRSFDMESDEVPDLLKIPRPLQEIYFDAAEQEAERLLKRIGGIDKLVEPIRGELSRGISRAPLRGEWRDMSIAVVDGSDTPVVSERIGVRYGLYAAAYKLFHGIEPLKNNENYVGNYLNEQIHENEEVFVKVLDLVTTYLERTLAKKLLESDELSVDLLIIDGSFLGYRTGCSLVKEQRIDFTEPLTNRHFETVFDLISEINKLTEYIADSGRAVGIIKRVPTRAIDGYMMYKRTDKKGLNLSDRAILSLVMDVGEVFSYGRYLGADEKVDAFSWYRSVSRDPKVRGKSPDDVLREAERRVNVQLTADLTRRGSRRGRGGPISSSIVKLARRMKRFYIRTVKNLPPICIDVPSSVSEDLLENVFSYCLETASPSTGLPMSLDLVDALVSLPRGLARDFANEVEALLLRRGADVSRLRILFSRYNPQKDE